MTGGCLEGVRVLELARYQAGPRGGMMMSDLGAEVIKIEPLEGEETRRYPPVVRGQSVYFSVYNRGKKSVCIDMRSARGKAVFQDLVKKSDVVLENFRPGTMKKMGFEYERLREINAGIILVSVSGFGQYGPYSDRPAFDALGQAMSGLMALTGKPLGKPVGTAFSVADRLTALHATIGALGALRHRDRTGEGQLVDVCLLDSALTMVEIPAAYYLSTGNEGGESGRLPYRAKDGWVVIQAGSRQMTARLEEIMSGKSSDGSLGPISNAMESTDKRRVALQSWCEARSVKEICDTLVSAGIPVAPVQSIPEVTKDPHLWEREMLVKTDDSIGGEMFVPGLTVKMSATPGRVGPIPSPGQHTDEILSSVLGYGDATINDLRQAKAVG